MLTKKFKQNSNGREHPFRPRETKDRNDEYRRA